MTKCVECREKCDRRFSYSPQQGTKLYFCSIVCLIRYLKRTNVLGPNWEIEKLHEF